MPSSVVTVMVTVPGFLAEMLPLESMEAMEESLELQVIFLLTAEDGDTVAETVSLLPSIKDKVDLLIETLVTAVDDGVGVTGPEGTPPEPPESPPHEASANSKKLLKIIDFSFLMVVNNSVSPVPKRQTTLINKAWHKPLV